MNRDLPYCLVLSHRIFRYSFYNFFYLFLFGHFFIIPELLFGFPPRRAAAVVKASTTLPYTFSPPGIEVSVVRASVTSWGKFPWELLKKSKACLNLGRQ